MTFLLYLTFIYLIFLITYYFIYLDKLNNDNLFTIILNFIFLIILPIYFFHLKDINYSLIISLFLLISSFFLNLKIKEAFHINKIPPLIYFILTSYTFGYILLTFLTK